MNMDAMNLIENCINLTINKSYSDLTYGQFISLLKHIFTEILNNENFNCITRTGYARDNMRTIGIDGLNIQLIKGAFIDYSIALEKEGKTYTKKDAPPQTYQDAVCLVMDSLEKQGASPTYQMVTQSPYLQELLIENYVHLLATTTQQERIESITHLAPLFGKQLKTLDNLETFFIQNNQQTMRETNKTY